MVFVDQCNGRGKGFRVLREVITEFLLALLAAVILSQAFVVADLRKNDFVAFLIIVRQLAEDFS